MLEKRLRSTHSTGNYISADINAALADKTVDITDIQYDNNYFDYVLCSHILAYVHDEAKAIDEMYRVLKPGGKALVLTLIDKDRHVTYENPILKTDAERLEYYGEPGMLRLHGNDFTDRLQKGNFAIHEIDYSLKLSDTEKDRLSIGDKKRELIFECRKS